MYRPTVYLATLLLAGLISLAPTASAQSAVDCPNTIRAVNGCDDYVPARVAQPAPQRAVPPSDAPKSTQGRSARPPVSAPAARRPAVVESGGLTFYTSRTDFDAANPGTTLEDFNDIAAPVGTWCGSTSPADENTDNDCVSAGDISSGLIVNANGHGGEVDALVGWGNGVLNPTVTFGANYFSHNTELQFNPGVQAVAADVYAWFGNPGTTVSVYDTGGNLLGSTSIPGTFG